jgi:hypothetical protein
MLTFKTIAAASVLGVCWLVALAVYLVGHGQGVTLALDTGRALVGVRPF